MILSVNKRARQRWRDNLWLYNKERIFLRCVREVIVSLCTGVSCDYETFEFTSDV